MPPMTPPLKSPASAPASASEQARADDIAAKSELMARELSQKRELRIRQERVRHLSSDEAPAKEPMPSRAGRVTARLPTEARPAGPKSSFVDDKTVRQPDMLRAEPSRLDRSSTSPPFYPAARPSVVDDVAVELEELMRDVRAGWRRCEAADRITLMAALITFLGVLLPWLGTKEGGWQMGLSAGGAVHAALAITAIVIVVDRYRRCERLADRERAAKVRRASLWHLLLGAASTLFCAYFLVVFGLQRAAAPELQIKFGLYVTLAAGMGLSYGGFSRFWGRHGGES